MRRTATAWRLCRNERLHRVCNCRFQPIDGNVILPAADIESESFCTALYYAIRSMVRALHRGFVAIAANEDEVGLCQTRRHVRRAISMARSRDWSHSLDFKSKIS